MRNLVSSSKFAFQKTMSMRPHDEQAIRVWWTDAECARHKWLENQSRALKPCVQSLKVFFYVRPAVITWLVMRASDVVLWKQPDVIQETHRTVLFRTHVWIWSKRLAQSRWEGPRRHMNAKWKWDTWHDKRFATDDCVISMSPSPCVARSVQEAATHSMLLTAQSCFLEWATVRRLRHNRFARNGSLLDNTLACVKTFAILHRQLLHVQCYSWYASATQQTHVAREFSWTRSSLSPRNTRPEHKAVTRAGTRKDYPPMQALYSVGSCSQESGNDSWWIAQKVWCSISWENLRCSRKDTSPVERLLCNQRNGRTAWCDLDVRDVHWCRVWHRPSKPSSTP